MTTNDCDPACIFHFKAMLVDSAEERLLAWSHYSDCEVATSLDSQFKSLACNDIDRREQKLERISQLATKPSATPTENTASKNQKYHFVSESEEQSDPCQASLYRSMA
ncbi:hypothetical protein HPB48_027108 [Haemaphysalis longicornis]|uniref:Uncharacterized protein n=1 Tax=Haemaphysalis longicornis TaxID=44386 RepID=A0A9J6HDZ7_HAELO|nr:hypothetical protein HPB48_027108 [Haemaphysalis longicornis]